MISIFLAAQLFSGNFVHTSSNKNGFQMIISIKMESLISLPDFIKKEYDPFASPPNYQLALQHRKATLVGLFNSKIKNKLCECCMLPINKQLIDLRCNDIQLSFLGTSLAMYFKLLKVTVLLLALLSIPLLLLQGMLFNKIFVCCQISSQLLVSLNMRASYPICFIVTSWIFFTGLTYLIKRYSQNEIYIIEKDHPTQEDYTLKLSNLPTSDQGQVKKMVQLCLGQKVASLDLAFDINQMHEAFLKREQLTMTKNKLDDAKAKNGTGLFTTQSSTSLLGNSRCQVTELNNQINRLDQILGKYKHFITFTPYKQIGIAFVSFEYKTAAQAALQRYQNIIAGKSKQVLSLKEKYELVQFRVITVEKAMNPKDVVWQNLNCQSKNTNLLLQISIIMIGLLTTLLLGTFLQNSKLRDILINFDLNVVNFFIILAAYCLYHGFVHCLVSFKIKLNKYTTYTARHSSSFRIYFLLNTFFACALPFFLHRNENQLIIVINFMVIIDALTHPLIKIFNCNHIYQRILGEYIKNLETTNNYYTQDYLNRLLQGREFRLGENYHFYLRAIFVLGFFSFAAPLVFLYYMVALVLQYIAQKMLLLRTCKIPPKISKNLVQLVITLLFYLPAVVLLGILTFKYHNSNFSLNNCWLQAILFCLSLVFSQFSVLQIEKDGEERNVCDIYYVSKAKFGQFYQTQNPIKKYDGSIYSSRSIPSQKICSSPECRDFQYFEDERNKKDMNSSHIRSINRLMSYNNEYFDLFISSEYKRLCDT